MGDSQQEMDESDNSSILSGGSTVKGDDDYKKRLGVQFDEKKAEENPEKEDKDDIWYIKDEKELKKENIPFLKSLSNKFVNLLSKSDNRKIDIIGEINDVGQLYIFVYEYIYKAMMFQPMNDDFGNDYKQNLNTFKTKLKNNGVYFDKLNNFPYIFINKENSAYKIESEQTLLHETIRSYLLGALIPIIEETTHIYADDYSAAKNDKNTYVTKTISEGTTFKKDKNVYVWDSNLQITTMDENDTFLDFEEETYENLKNTPLFNKVANILQHTCDKGNMKNIVMFIMNWLACDEIKKYANDKSSNDFVSVILSWIKELVTPFNKILFYHPFLKKGDIYQFMKHYPKSLIITMSEKYNLGIDLYFKDSHITKKLNNLDISKIYKLEHTYKLEKVPDEKHIHGGFLPRGCKPITAPLIPGILSFISNSHNQIKNFSPIAITNQFQNQHYMNLCSQAPDLRIVNTSIYIDSFEYFEKRDNMLFNKYKEKYFTNIQDNMTGMNNFGDPTFYENDWMDVDFPEKLYTSLVKKTFVYVIKTFYNDSIWNISSIQSDGDSVYPKTPEQRIDYEHIWILVRWLGLDFFEYVFSHGKRRKVYENTKIFVKWMLNTPFMFPFATKDTLEKLMKDKDDSVITPILSLKTPRRIKFYPLEYDMKISLFVDKCIDNEKQMEVLLRVDIFEKKKKVLLRCTNYVKQYYKLCFGENKLDPKLESFQSDEEWTHHLRKYSKPYEDIWNKIISKRDMYDTDCDTLRYPYVDEYGNSDTQNKLKYGNMKNWMLLQPKLLPNDYFKDNNKRHNILFQKHKNIFNSSEYTLLKKNVLINWNTEEDEKIEDATRSDKLDRIIVADPYKLKLYAMMNPYKEVFFANTTVPGKIEAIKYYKDKNLFESYPVRLENVDLKRMNSKIQKKLPVDSKDNQIRTYIEKSEKFKSLMFRGEYKAYHSKIKELIELTKQINIAIKSGNKEDAKKYLDKKRSYGIEFSDREEAYYKNNFFSKSVERKQENNWEDSAEFSRKRIQEDGIFHGPVFRTLDKSSFTQPTKEDIEGNYYEKFEKEGNICSGEYPYIAFNVDKGKIEVVCGREKWISEAVLPSNESIRRLDAQNKKTIKKLKTLCQRWCPTLGHIVRLWRWIGIICMGESIKDALSDINEEKLENSEQNTNDQVASFQLKFFEYLEEKQKNKSFKDVCSARIWFLVQMMESNILFPFINNFEHLQKISFQFPDKVVLSLDWSASGRCRAIKYSSGHTHTENYYVDDLVDKYKSKYIPTVMRLKIFDDFNGTILVTNSEFYFRNYRKLAKCYGLMKMNDYSYRTALPGKKRKDWDYWNYQLTQVPTNIPVGDSEMLTSRNDAILSKIQSLRNMSDVIQASNLSQNEFEKFMNIKALENEYIFYSKQIAQGTLPSQISDILHKLKNKAVSIFHSTMGNEKFEQGQQFLTLALCQRPEFIDNLRHLYRQKYGTNKGDNLTRSELCKLLLNNDHIKEMEVQIYLYELENVPQDLKNEDGMIDLYTTDESRKTQIESWLLRHYGVSLNKMKTFNPDAKKAKEEFQYHEKNKSNKSKNKKEESKRLHNILNFLKDETKLKICPTEIKSDLFDKGKINLCGKNISEMKVTEVLESIFQVICNPHTNLVLNHVVFINESSKHLRKFWEIQKKRPIPYPKKYMSMKDICKEVLKMYHQAYNTHHITIIKDVSLGEFLQNREVIGIQNGFFNGYSLKNTKYEDYKDVWGLWQAFTSGEGLNPRMVQLNVQFGGKVGYLLIMFLLNSAYSNKILNK